MGDIPKAIREQLPETVEGLREYLSRLEKEHRRIEKLLAAGYELLNIRTKEQKIKSSA